MRGKNCTRILPALLAGLVAIAMAMESPAQESGVPPPPVSADDWAAPLAEPDEELPSAPGEAVSPAVDAGASLPAVGPADGPVAIDSGKEAEGRYDFISVPSDNEADDETTREEGLISIALDNVDLEDVVRMFTRISDANIIATSSNLVGSVTVNLTDVQWKAALTSILGMHSLALVEAPPGSRVYTIVPRAADAPEPMIVETIFLKYTSVADIGQVIRLMLAPGGAVSEFPSRNALVLRTTDANRVEINDVVEEIDVPGKQVCIETKFMELNDQATRKLGIRWDSLDEFGINLQAGPFTSTESTEKSQIRSDTQDRWDRRNNRDDVIELYDDDNVQYQVESTEIVELPDGTFITRTKTDPTREVTDTIDRGQEVSQTVVDQFTHAIVQQQAAILTIDSLNVILSALRQLDGVSIISNPKIIVANGNTNAHFSVGEREPIIRKEIQRGTTDSPGDIVTAQLDTQLNTDYIRDGYLQTGIDLRVIPVVKTDDLIEAEITPTLRRKIGNKQVEDNTWPIISVKEIRTRFTLRSGQTVAIGGLTDTQDSKNESKVPLLGDIPLLGKYLFSHSEDVTRQVETIIFVTLSLAQPEMLSRGDGIPEDAELVHKKLIESSARKQKFQADIESIREAAGKESADRENKAKSRLLRRRR